MAFIDEIKARVPTARLVQLTNADNPNASTVNDARLQKAIDDASSEFEDETATEADDTKNSHIRAVYWGTLYYLHLYLGKRGQAFTEARDRWNEQVGKVGKVTGRNKAGGTSSPLEPTDESASGRRIFPDFDSKYRSSFVPDPPRG